MAVEQSAVQITINVVDENSGPAIKTVTQNIDQLGVAGKRAGTQVASGLKEIGGHALTSLDNVRLLRDDLGVRIPRSMERAIASSRLLSESINAIGSGLLAFGAIDIFARMGQGAYQFYERYVSLAKVSQDYYAEVAKNRQADFGNTRSIEDTRARIAAVTNEIKQLDAAQQRASARGFWFNSINNIVNAHDYAEAAFDRRRQLDALQQKQLPEQQHQLAMAAIERDHSAAGLSGSAARRAELDARLAANLEDQKYAAEQDKQLHNLAASSAGESLRQIEDEKAKRQYRAESHKADLAEIRETMRMQAEAREANMSGEKLYADQRDTMLAQLKAKLEDTELSPLQYAKQVAATNDRYDKERLKRLEDIERQTAKIERESSAVGLSGMAKIQADLGSRVGDIKDDPALEDYPAQRARRIEAAQAQANAEMAQTQKQFAEEIDSIIEQSQGRELQGFARIRAEADRARNDLQKRFDRETNLMDISTPSGQQQLDAMTGQFGRGMNGIDAGEAIQRADLQRKNALETDQLESEARAKFLSAEKQQTTAIQTEYEQRLEKFKEQLGAQEISQQDYDRRVLAAGQLRDAELVESARQAREKMAGEFSRFFQNPLGALKEFGDKAAGQAAAALVQRVQGRFGGATTGPGDFFGALAGMPHLPGMPEYSHGLSGRASNPSGAMSVASAQIYVGNASIAFGGGGGYGSGAGYGGRTITGGGSTPLLTGGSVGSAGGFGGGGTSSFGGGFGAGSAAGSVGGGVLNDLYQGGALASQARGIFGRGGSSSTTGGYADVSSMTVPGSFDKNGKFSVSGSSNGGMLGGGGFMANAGGAFGGATGLFSAYQGNGGIGGALGGAMSGMQIGMAVGGPIGAAIGAAGGAVLGAIGFGGREKARVYDLKTVRPRITADLMGYQQGTTDYLSALSDLQGLDQEARRTLDKMGPSGHSYYWDNVNREIKQAQGRLTGEQRAGRSLYTASAAQYATGIDAVPRDGMALLHRNEMVVNAPRTERITRALENGADSARMPTESAWGGDVHVHLNSIDSQSGVRWLMGNKHVLRAAVNESLGENSGGSDAWS